MKTELASRMLPLLRSIAGELAERTRRVEHLESMVSALEPTHAAHAEDLAVLRAELADERRAVRLVQEELHALGCSVDSLEPLTLRIRAEADGDLTWRLGDAELEPSLSCEPE